MPYIIALIVIVLIGVGFTLLQAPTVPSELPEVTTTEEPTIPRDLSSDADSAELVDTDSDYDDGTYETITTYLTPARDEYLLEISLTLADDIITNANIEYAQGAETNPNPQRFDAAYKAEIIGKDIDALNLSRVGGASLTTAAFNNALEDIKDQAS